MASFSVNDADQYGGQGGGGFFSLKNDKDKANVRFLYDDINDVQGLSVHEVQHNGKKRYVNCLREYGDPVNVCPMCEASMPVRAKYFVPLYDIDKGTVVTWERGKKFGGKLSALCSHYPNLVTHRFQIERNGRAGDKETFYEIYPLQDDPQDADLTVGDFEFEPVLGGLVLNKTASEMDTYLRTGSFPADKGGEDLPRRGAPVDDMPRRTPNGGERRVF